MSWRDNLLDATFRGIPFKVWDASTGGGRQVVGHEYFKTSEVFNQDLGAAKKTYTLTAYVIQNQSNQWNYFRERDALVKALTGHIINELSHPELDLVGAKVVKVTKELAEEHYRHLKEKEFYDELIKYIMGHYHTKKVLALVYQGSNIINKVRDIVGHTHPEQAHPKSIRGKYGRITEEGIFENVVHASENKKEAEREIKLWFKPSELTHTVYPTKKSKSTKEELIWS